MQQFLGRVSTAKVQNEKKTFWNCFASLSEVTRERSKVADDVSLYGKGACRVMQPAG